ncbi:tannase/feruloyl esterase family alpha/beta hydrolase [Pseudorhodoferax sp.]|uniref:tannase/feruloyl esterase family alpha/beta hydrolase n=1 Tax=Pseudorhodoferax sp. TaxID=1993553 RepID=UPI002DD619A5|nr:tannase/feruloyl esterase family alpha/beta hydrolase [Pseudorhodoferax sp.]
MPCLVLLPALLLGACGTPPSTDTATAPHARRVLLPDAQGRCAALAQTLAQMASAQTDALPLPRINTRWQPAGAQLASDADGRAATTVDLPAHCVVQGRLDERTGAHAERYHTSFELRLPATANGRLLQQGTEGLGGSVPPALGRNTGATGWVDNGLQRGFAAVSHNAGHATTGALFGLDPQARTEHAWRSHWRVATAARLLFRAYYGQPPRHSYFIGCGDGGRQGLMFAQRFAELFDGIVAQAPTMRAGLGEVVASAWAFQRLHEARTATGQAHALSARQLRRVADEVLDRCDAADGLADGLVSDTALCRIDPRRLLCPASVPGDDDSGCLHAAQALALARVMNGPEASDGRPLHMGWPWDPGIGSVAWLAALESPPPVISAALPFVYVTPPDATLTLPTFDFERDPLRLLAAHRLLGSADDVLLRPFLQRGGKLMLVHGMADPVVSALQTIDFQQRVNAAHGAVAAARFVRTFLVPGMNHCHGGPATDAFDGLGAIVDWVESHKAPDVMFARGSGTLPGTLQRPLCTHPKISRYREGDPAQADSFECR